MQQPRTNQLDVAGLSHLFDNNSECYKLFCFRRFWIMSVIVSNQYTIWKIRWPRKNHMLRILLQHTPPFL